jgi:hypothetical protein
MVMAIYDATRTVEIQRRLANMWLSLLSPSYLSIPPTTFFFLPPSQSYK